VEFIFLYPRFLLLLLLVPFFIAIYLLGMTYNHGRAFLFANFEAMQRFYNLEFFSKNFLALYINIIILIMFIFAISGTAVSFNVDTSSFSYVIAIDNSDSMATIDVLPNRLEAAKNSAKDFVDLLPVGVKVGVIGFSGDSVVLQTLDSSKIKSKIAIDNLDYGPIQGTNIYNALISSNKLFEENQIKSVILISDGQLNVGDAPQINKYVERNGLIVNTIAVGTLEGGITEFNTISKTDEDFLKSLAFNSGGRSFRAGDFEELEKSFDTLILETNREVTIDLSFYFLLIGIALFTILWILHNFRFRVFPV
jgi:Ca-activated chloride channel family protein|tara:strand:- start:264 stop:1190 length:927 start_codon:yes stop_codon:yes gene_type:complete